jgi:hypothetical protein
VASRFGNGCSEGISEMSLFGSEKKPHDSHQGGGLSAAFSPKIPDRGGDATLQSHSARGCSS